MTVRRRVGFLVALICLSGALHVSQGEENAPAIELRPSEERLSDAAMTVVVYNENDPDSAELARFYAAKRAIAPENLIALKCSTAEEITRAEYETALAEPLREIFRQRGWWKLRVADHPLGRLEASKIRFVALMRGIPLRIAALPDQPAQPGISPLIGSQNGASVDSELTALGLFSPAISGVLGNPYYRSFTRIRDAHWPAPLLVCRLDAPTPEIVRRMITDSLAAERGELRGFTYIDARGIRDAGLVEGDNWLFKIATQARRGGFPVILDRGEGLFPPDYPMRNAAFYFGWYTSEVSGPMAREGFKFTQGAIAVHIHSFSAVTLRDPKRAWCAPMLAAGAAVTMGNVAEPFLALTPNLDVFHDRLLAGFTFAESAWMSERSLSWMTTFVGDPLYRPFPAEFDRTTPPVQSEWDAYAAGAKQWFQNHDKGEARLQASAKKLRSGIIWEGLGLLQLTANLPAKAIDSFAKARETYSDPADILRATIHEVIQLRALHKSPAALLLIQKQLTRYPQASGAEILRSFEAEL